MLFIFKIALLVFVAARLASGRIFIREKIQKNKKIFQKPIDIRELI